MAWFPTNTTKSSIDDNYVLNVLNYINKFNQSLSIEQLKCFEHEEQDRIAKKQEEQQGCEVSWDSLLCWPRTLPATLATIPCFDELNGIPYDNTRK